MNAARQHGRHGATFPARRQALSRGEVLHYENIQSLSCVEARNFSPLTRGASRPCRNFPEGTGGTIENCIYAREGNLLPLSICRPVFDHLLADEKFSDPGGIPSKTAFARDGIMEILPFFYVVYQSIA